MFASVYLSWLRYTALCSPQGVEERIFARVRSMSVRCCVGELKMRIAFGDDRSGVASQGLAWSAFFSLSPA